MGDEKPFHNPFAALSGLRDSLSQVSPSAEPASSAEPPPPPAPAPVVPGAKGPARAVVRYERSGRGGKQVTVIEQLSLGAAERAEWLKAFKAALGCGGVIEGDTLVLQGDQRKRLPALLSARHVRRVTVS
jgi:translation initiation factor 1